MTKQTPQLTASFVLDANGKPKIQVSGRHKHYSIRLSVKNAPSDAYAVTYILHPTYYDPVREVRDKDSDFTEELTSYGDYEIQAKVRSSEYPLPLRRDLYDALAETYSKNLNPDILKALKDIQEN